MLRATLLLATVLVTAPAPAAAQTDSTAHFQPFSFLAGSCWKGAFPGGGAEDEHCFEWVYGGKFLRDRHVVTGAKTPYAGETLYAWDAKAQRVIYWYVGSDGNHSTGHAEYRPEGIVFPETHVSASGTREIRNTWTRMGDDAYRVEVVELTKEGVKPLWTMELRRSRPAK